MFLNLLLLFIIALVAFWHFVQGFFSATISAALVVVSAALARAYTEPLIAWIKPQHWVDSSQSIALCVLFAVIYLLLRLAFDRLVPGNVQLNNLADKIGAALVGLLAGIFAAGVVALALQMLPVGPSIGGYARFPVGEERKTALRANPKDDLILYSPLQVADFSGPPNSLFLAPDDAVVGAVNRLSANYLSCGQLLACVHPDLLTELFGQRLGFQAGARACAPNYPGKTQRISVAACFRLAFVTQFDAQPAELRPDNIPPLDPSITPKTGQTLLVVRVVVDESAADIDGVFRFATGNCRLVVRTDDACKDYFPLGTLEAAQRLYANHVDDPLFVKFAGPKRDIDLVFMIDSPLDDISPLQRLEIKRLGMVDLTAATDAAGSPLAISQPITFDPNVQVLRQTEVQPMPLVATIDPKAVKTAPLLISGRETSSPDRLPVALPVPSSRPSDKIQKEGLDANFTNSCFTDLSAQIKNSGPAPSGASAIDQLLVPEGKIIVQFNCRSNPDNSLAWASQIGRFELIDMNGNHYKPRGVFCLLNQPDSSQFIVARYSTTNTIQNINISQATGATAADIRLYYLLPPKTPLAELHYNDDPIKDLRPPFKPAP